jgi:hypothetical protein
MIDGLWYLQYLNYEIIKKNQEKSFLNARNILNFTYKEILKNYMDILLCHFPFQYFFSKGHMILAELMS